MLISHSIAASPWNVAEVACQDKNCEFLSPGMIRFERVREIHIIIISLGYTVILNWDLTYINIVNLSF
jgi:hypothetical protein